VPNRQLAGKGRGAVTESLPTPSPKRTGVIHDVSGVRIKSRLEMLAPRSIGFPDELSSLKKSSYDTEKREFIIATRELCGETLGQHVYAGPLR
jgi:hypothetical protein